MPTTFPWLFEGKEGKELARYTGVQRAYAGDKVIDESPDDGQRLGELIDLQGDMLRYEWINPSGEKEVVAAPSCEVRAAQSRPEKAKEDQPSSSQPSFEGDSMALKTSPASRQVNTMQARANRACLHHGTADGVPSGAVGVVRPRH